LSPLRFNSAALVENASKTGAAVGAFNVIQLEHAESYALAALETGLPVIAQISENAIAYHGSLEPIVKATLAISENSKIPMSVHLDHVENTDLIRAALDLGCDSVMFDGSKLEYKENVNTSIKMRELAHSYGASIEVELGEIGGKDGVHAPGIRTKPEDARRFVAETGVDLLAVAVGSSHAMATRDAKLDFELITELKEAAGVPLVLHGSSGVSDQDIVAAVKAGISKVNIATHLNIVFTESIRKYLAYDEKVNDPRKYMKEARSEVSLEVSRLLRLLALK
jgi:fructose-bisphosphate aldolase class II